MKLKDADKEPGPAASLVFQDGWKALDALPVTFLFEFRGSADHDSFARVTDGPLGTRSVFEVKYGTVRGPRIRAETMHPSSDWATDHPDGRRMLDVRITLRTDDGHAVLMTYGGMILGQRIEIAPRFQADDDGPYAWLNLVQAIGFGRRNEDMSLTYRVYAL